MSRSKRRNWKGPAQSGIGVDVPPEVEAAWRKGRSSMLREQQQEIDAKIDQVRADAQALETAAKILDDAPRNIFPVPHKAETVAALFALAAGMRLAAGRFHHSDDCPF